jgi:broad specificity polyphosphatase/5'/3'-nucleotidase SurE
LLFRDTSLSGSTTNSAAIEGLARSHKSIVETWNVQEQIASVQMELAMFRELGDDVSARQCIEALKQLHAKLASINTEANASSFTGVTYASSWTGDLPPVEEVDLTGGDLMYPSKERTNEEVDLTNLDETEKDGEEMYSTDVEAAEV